MGREVLELNGGKTRESFSTVGHGVGAGDCAGTWKAISKFGIRNKKQLGVQRSQTRKGYSSDYKNLE